MTKVLGICLTFFVEDLLAALTYKSILLLDWTAGLLLCEAIALAILKGYCGYPGALEELWRHTMLHAIKWASILRVII